MLEDMKCKSKRPALGNLWRTSIMIELPLYQKNDSVISKMVEMETTRKLRHEERAIVKKVNVQGFLIRLECCFLL